MIILRLETFIFITTISNVYCENNSVILNPNEELESVDARHKNIKFNDDSMYDERQGYEHSKFPDQNTERPHIMQDNVNVDMQSSDNVSNELYNNGARVKFQDENSLETNKLGLKKRRRRRRRRRPEQGPVPPPGLAGAYVHQGPYPVFGPQPVYRPPRPPSSYGALVSVAGALSSIARHDDRGCVPRLLCEAAGGAGGGGTGGGVLQPLITLLAAYNGVGASPLVVFGRAVLLGITAGAEPDACRRGYPLCPTAPDELVHYLNNHNGGFFRFFNAQRQGHQKLEQFYSHLSSLGTPDRLLSDLYGSGSDGFINQYTQNPSNVQQKYAPLNQNVNHYTYS